MFRWAPSCQRSLVPLFIVGLSGTLAGSVTAPRARASFSVDSLADAEKRVFNQTVTSPRVLLRALYASHQILVLAAAGHQTITPYELLDSLLQDVGHDPHLRYIVLERPQDNAAILQASSVDSMTTADRFTHLAAQFPSPLSAQNSLCWSPEWAYTWETILPHVQAVNAHRTSRKLRITSVDGISSQRPMTWPGSFSSLFDGEAYVVSTNREVETANHFQNDIWAPLAPDDKIIMVYQYTHVIKHLTAYSRKRMVDSTTWRTDTSDLSWLSMWLHSHPQAESKIAVTLIDEMSASYSPHGVLEFTQRQIASHAGQAFGIPVAPFRDVTRERGADVFVPDAFGATYASGAGTASLPDMIDAVVWWPENATQNLQESSVYLPFCPEH